MTDLPEYPIESPSPALRARILERAVRAPILRREPPAALGIASAATAFVVGMLALMPPTTSGEMKDAERFVKGTKVWTEAMGKALSSPVPRRGS